MKKASGADFGRSLTGFGINLLVRNVLQQAAFLRNCFSMTVIRADDNFAIIAYGKQVFMLHSDASYWDNPLPSLLPELGARDAGVELRLYETDPDEALARAIELEKQEACSVLRACSDRPHGLRECYILDSNGYCWIPISLFFC